MADYVASIESKFVDSTSAGANAAGAALDKLTTATDAVTVSTDRATKSATTLVNQNIASAAAAQKVATATTALSTATATMSAAVARGAATQEQMDAVISNLTTKLQAAKAAHDALTGGVTTLGTTMDKATASVGSQNFALQQFKVQSTQAFSSILSGQPIMTTFLQQGHQLLDISESTGVSLRDTLGAAVKQLGTFLTGPVGIIALFGAAAAGAAYMGVESLNAQQKINQLSVSMRSVTSDYMGAAAAATAAGKAFASANPGTSVGDATQAAATNVAIPGFNDTASSQATLLATESNLAAMWSTTLPDAAKKLADALKDPGAEADLLAKQNFPGMTAAIEDSIKQMEASGNMAGAQAKLLDVLATASDGAAKKTGPLNDALGKLHDAFAGLTGSSKSFSDLLGEGFSKDVLFAIGQLTDLLNTMAAARAAVTPADPSGKNAYSRGAKASQLTGSNPDQSGPLTGGPISGTINNVLGALGEMSQSAILTALQHAENAAPNANGTWATSPTGAVGAFQVTPTTYKGMGADPTDFPMTAKNYASGASLSNDTVNTTAAAELWNHLLSKYGDPYTAVLAYHDGETVIDKLLAGTGTASPAAYAEANAVVGGGSTGRTSVAVPGAATTGVFSNTSQSNSAAYNDAMKAASGEATAIADLNSKIQALQADQAKQDPSSAQYAKDGAAIGVLTGQLSTHITAQAALAKQLDETNLVQMQQGAAAQAVFSAIQKLNDETFKATGQQVSAGEAADVTTKILAGLGQQLDTNLAKQDAQSNATIAAATAMAAGSKTSGDYTEAQKAAAEALDFTTKSSANYQATVDKITASDKLAKQAQLDLNAAVADAAQSKSNNDQLQVLQLQAAGIGENNDLLTKQVDLLKTTQSLENQQAGGSQTPAGQAILAQRAAIDDTTAAIKRQQDALGEVSSFASQAFSTIGDDITQAFVQGSAAGVNFGTVMQGVLAQVLEEVLKLAILNPIINSISGGSAATLSGLIGTGSGNGSSSGLSGLLGTFGSVAGVANSATGGSSSGGSGLLGSASSIYSIGKGIYSSASGGVSATGIGALDGILNTSTGLGASTAAETGEGAAQLGVGSTGATSVGGATLGGLAGGIGAGGALGSLANQYVFKGNQQNGEIGAYVGAAAGAIVGSVVPVIGTLIGGLIGGVLGGGGGGLIGPQNAPNYGYEVTQQAGANGLVGVSKSGGEGDPGGQAAQALAKQASAYDDALNQILAQAGISASGSTILGANNYSKGGKGDAANGNAGKETTDVNSTFDNLTFSSQNPILNAALNNPLTKPQNIQQLSDMSTAFSDLAKNLGTLLNPLSGTNDALGSLGTAQANLNANYATAIQEAKLLGLSTDGLTSAQATANKALTDAATAQVNTALLGFEGRDDVATGNGGAASVKASQTSAAAETAAFSKSLTDLYGTNFKLTAQYAQDMAQLAKTQADEQAAQITTDQQTYAGTGAQLQGRQDIAGGASQVSEGSALTTFDISASQQQTALKSQLSGMLQEGAISTQQYYAQITQLDQTLAAERLAIDKQYVDQATAELNTLSQQDQSYQARTDAAQGNQEGADLINQSISGANELAALKAQITSYYGDTAQAQSVYADQSTQLEATLAAEKLAIQQKYDTSSADAATAWEQQQQAIMDAAYQTVTGYLQNIDNFVKGLANGALSPLSPDAQYQASLSTFTTEATGAKNGNAADIADITNAAQALLEASKNVNGSGAQYVTDFNAVTAALAAIANGSTAANAASDLANQANMTAQQLASKAIADLTAELAKLRGEIQQQGAKPK